MFAQLRLIAEALDAGHLSDQLGGAECSAADQVEQFGGLLLHERHQLALERVDPLCQLAAAADQFAADQRLRAFATSEAALYPLEPAAAVEGPGRQLKFGREFMQVPAQPVLDASALADEVVSVIVQQSDLPLRPGEHGNGQIGIAHEGAGDRKRVDRV